MTDAITIHTEVPASRRVTLTLPDDMPLGPIEVVVRPLLREQAHTEAAELTRDEITKRLRAAGLLWEFKAPPDAVDHSPEEIMRVGALFVGDRPSHELIDEDRGEY